jgi:2-polyprenyl-3-methyl-5-hydroxy-6-metoxy-1,4-benzoquinol methylase
MLVLMTSIPQAEARRDAVAEQLFSSVIGALETLHVYVGRELGLYEALDGAPPVTASDFAGRAGIAPRYAREWLEQQAAAGVLDVAEETGDAATRTFRLPDGVAEVVCRPDSLALVAPLAPMVVGVAKALPAVLEAFRSGGGVPYDAYGEDIRRGIADINRPSFVNQLGAEWIPSLPDLHERLGSGGRIADLGCGEGASTLALARAYPRAEVLGLDLDPSSIEAARAAAGEVEVTFECRDAADPALAGSFDLVTLFETLHDMAHPVQALAAARSMLTPEGAVLVGDEKVADRFAAPGDEMERFNYGWSALHCLAAAMTEADSAATGTVIREETVRAYATDAGFGSCTVLPIEHDFWRFYRLDH